jgi:dihydrofolate synthase/folylpolyglutamate synthase
MTVGLAFDYFASEKVDIAIIEVGLGGRLDSTNIIIPEIAVITNIGLDHTQFLGETLPEIAFEKAGIIKKNIPVVIGEKQTEVENVFYKKAIENNSMLIFASDEFKEYQTDLLGDYQKANSKTAAAVIKHLKGFEVAEKEIIKGLVNVVKNTNLKGRWQILQENPKVICDTAHNKEGLSLVLNQLKREEYNKLHMVVGFVSDKKLEDVLSLFPADATYYFCRPDIPRGMSEVVLREKAAEFNLIGKDYKSVQKAFENALSKASQRDIIYVGGSTFVVAEII